MMDCAANWLGIGLYTAAEASRLLELPVAKVRRWLGGYRGAEQDYAPLWTPQLPKLDGQLGLGFLDLMQVRLVARIVEETDISLQKLRRALALARELVDHSHPLTTARFRTDGHRLFVEIGRETDAPHLYDLLGKQYGFHRIIEPSFKDVDLDLEITRWWPLGKQRSVVLDPQRSFGTAIASHSGISTAALALAAERHGSPREVARWCPPATRREVRDAIAFERRLAGPPAPRGSGGAPPAAAPQPAAPVRRAHPLVAPASNTRIEQFAFTTSLNDLMLVASGNRRCATPAA